MNTARKLRPHTQTDRGDVPRCWALSLLQKPLYHMGIQKNYCLAYVQWGLTQLLPAPASTAQKPVRDNVCSHRPRHSRPLFRCKTPVAQRSAPGYRTAPSHLVFMEPTLLRAAARFAVTSPLAVKPRRCRAWRSHGRLRVRKSISRVTAASHPLLGAAARVHAGRSHGRHRVRQRSSRAAVLLLLLVAASLRLLVALPRAPPRAATQQPRRRPLPPRRRLPSPRVPP
jgi:hypothetical protein